MKYGQIIQFFSYPLQITGWCLIGIGVWLSISDYQYFRILPSYHFLSADNFILFCGVLTTFIAFLGCCGSWFEYKVLLNFYLISILVVMILEILTGSFGYFYRLTVHHQLKAELLQGIKLVRSFKCPKLKFKTLSINSKAFEFD